MWTWRSEFDSPRDNVRFVGQDLMHRTNNCASVFALHWLTRPNYGKPWLEDRSPGRPEPPYT